MAQPISFIQIEKPTEEEIVNQKLDSLKTLLAKHDEALNQIMEIISELQKAGILEVANSILLAKEDIARLTLHQLDREPVTNFLNHLTGITGALSEIDPEITKKLTSSISIGITDAHSHIQNNQKVNLFDLIKVLNDPEINMAIGFLISFLKGMGKGLKEE